MFSVALSTFSGKWNTLSMIAEKCNVSPNSVAFYQIA